MTHTPLKGDGQLGRAHYLALCQEIGERLRLNLDADPTDTPLHLLQTMKRFQRAE